MNRELSIVVPVYNEEANIKKFLDAIHSALEHITESYEIIFAVDPCSDRTEEIIISEYNNDPRIKMLRFSRRFGQPAAIWAGLTFSSGNAVINIDCDMQDPPELIPDMLELWKRGYKVVIPQRRTRMGEFWAKRLVSWGGYWVINKLADVEIPRNCGDFRLLDRSVVNELIQLHESNCFLRGLTAVVGFKTALLPFDRKARAEGKGKYPSLGSFKNGLDGIVAFSSRLLNLMIIAGLFLAIFSILAMLLLFAAKIYGWWQSSSGVATLAVFMMFLTGCQFVGLGILGAYIGRIYDDVKNRPKFIVEYQLGFDTFPCGIQ